MAKYDKEIMNTRFLEYWYEFAVETLGKSDVDAQVYALNKLNNEEL
tara:strand:+ start:315 stop:452 length:138 start_codon:yes stop_codon:yes gene_type:complete